MSAPQRGLEVTDPARYRSRVLDLLGGRDPLEILAQTPDVLAGIVRMNSADTLRTRPFAGKWTPNEIIGHLVDTEWVYGYRLRLILCQDQPTILGMDQELWVAGQRHNQREPADLVGTFTAVRHANLVLWRRLTPAELERVGMHNERGPESLDMIRRMSAGHDLSHIDQMKRYIEAIAKAL